MIILPHLETNITTACQNRCWGCNHFVPLQVPTYANPSDIESDLAKLATVARAERYALVGGKPLLHPQIVDIIRTARRSGISPVIEVITNGILLKRMPTEFWSEIDHLLVSVYPGKLGPDMMGWVSDKCAMHEVKLQIRDVVSDPFIAPLYRQKATREQAHARYRQCWYVTGVWYCHTLDDGYFFRCSIMPFIPEMILGLPEGTDGLPLDGITEDKLVAYLNQKETPQSCCVCGSHDAPRQEWHEVTRDRWLEESMV